MPKEKVATDTKLKVVYHEDHSTSVEDYRLGPKVCKDCRYAGWLTQREFSKNSLPQTCLHYSGGADPQDGDRVKLDETNLDWDDYVRGGPTQTTVKAWRKLYPLCQAKNQDGQCDDYLQAKKQSWFTRRFRRRRMRE